MGCGVLFDVLQRYFVLCSIGFSDRFLCSAP